MGRCALRVTLCLFHDGPEDGREAHVLPLPETAFVDVQNKVQSIYERRSSVIPPVHYVFVRSEPLPH